MEYDDMYTWYDDSILDRYEIQRLWQWRFHCDVRSMIYRIKQLKPGFYVKCVFTGAILSPNHNHALLY